MNRTDPHEALARMLVVLAVVLSWVAAARFVWDHLP